MPRSEKRSAIREARKRANEVRAATNRVRHEEGKLTPWEQAQAARKARRIGKPRQPEKVPLEINYALRNKDFDVPSKKA